MKERKNPQLEKLVNLRAEYEYLRAQKKKFEMYNKIYTKQLAEMKDEIMQKDILIYCLQERLKSESSMVRVA